MKIKNLIFKLGLPAVLLVCFVMGMYGLAFANGAFDSSENAGTDFSQADVKNASLENDLAYVNSNSVSYVTISDANNTTNVNFKLDSQAKTTYAFSKVKVEYSMYYKDTVTRHNSITVDTADISAADEFSVGFNDYGKFVCIVYFINASDQVVWTETDEDVRVTADTYNFAPLSGSMPVTSFSMMIWDNNSIRHDGPIICMLERTRAFNWDKLPQDNLIEGPDRMYGMYVCPYLDKNELINPSSFYSNIFIYADYVRDLLSLKTGDNSKSFVNLFCNDINSGIINLIIYANSDLIMKQSDSNYSVTLLSDGSYTYSSIRNVYNKSYDENIEINNELKKFWENEKKEAMDSQCPSELGKRIWTNSYNCYAICCADSNVKLSVLNFNLIKTPNDNNQFALDMKNSSYVIENSLVSGLNQIKLLGVDTVNSYKALFNLNDNLFQKAVELGKSPFLIIGSGLGDNNDLEDYAKIIMTYYGTKDYCYYYKAHPNFPIDKNPFRQETYDLLDIEDVDAAVPAELIIFFNPALNICGYQSSVFQSVDNNLDKAMFNTSKEFAMSDNPVSYSCYKYCDFWASAINDNSTEAIKSLCDMRHKNFLVEFSDSLPTYSSYDMAIWDSTDSKFKYYKNYSITSINQGVSFNCPISAGDYTINSFLNSSKVLDVCGGSVDNGANVQLYTHNNTNAQKWSIDVNSGGFCTIKSLNSNKCLDVSGGTANNCVNVQQYEENGTLAQKWLIINSGDKYKIASAVYRWYTLDIAGGNTYDGTNVWIYSSNWSDAQFFNISSINPKVPASDVNIVSGDYYIKSTLSSYKVMNVYANNNNNGGNIALGEYSVHDSNQIFNIQKSGDFYLIKNVRSGKYLDADGGGLMPGTNIQQWEYVSNNPNQLWAAYKVGTSVVFVNVANGLAADVCGASTLSNTNIWCNTRNDSSAQLWHLEQACQWALADLADGVYAICSKSNVGYVLDVYGGSCENGANVQLYENNSTLAQKWKITTKNGISSIVNVGSGLSLDLCGGNICCGTNIWQYSANGTAAQQWKIYKSSNGSFKIASASNKYIVLDLSGGNPVNGQNIQVWDCNGTDAQNWLIS